MTEAEIAADRYHARQDAWPGSKFKPSARAVRETSALAPGAIFYRYPDGSVLRLDRATGDLVA